MLAPSNMQEREIQEMATFGIQVQVYLSVLQWNVYHNYMTSQ